MLLKYHTAQASNHPGWPTLASEVIAPLKEAIEAAEKTSSEPSDPKEVLALDKLTDLANRAIRMPDGRFIVTLEWITEFGRLLENENTLKYTNERPTRPGVYYWKRDIKSDAVLIRLTCGTDNSLKIGLGELSSIVGGLWAGPLPEPR